MVQHGIYTADIIMLCLADPLLIEIHTTELNRYVVSATLNRSFHSYVTLTISTVSVCVYHI
jgi:hypothetical protein